MRKYRKLGSDNRGPRKYFKGAHAKRPAWEPVMQGSDWLQEALESAVRESKPVEDKIGLARLAILERLVSPGNPNRDDEDALFEALDALRALQWERLSNVPEMSST